MKFLRKRNENSDLDHPNFPEESNRTPDFVRIYLYNIRKGSVEVSHGRENSRKIHQVVPGGEGATEGGVTCTISETTTDTSSTVPHYLYRVRIFRKFSLNFLGNLLEISRHHHENKDGEG
jgi:hypothetical protein